MTCIKSITAINALCTASGYSDTGTYPIFKITFTYANTLTTGHSTYKITGNILKPDGKTHIAITTGNTKSVTISSIIPSSGCTLDPTSFNYMNFPANMTSITSIILPTTLYLCQSGTYAIYLVADRGFTLPSSVSWTIPITA